MSEGPSQYKGGLYKIASFERWVVIVSGPKLVDEFARVSDETMSMQGALDAVSSAFSHSLIFTQCVRCDKEVPAIPFVVKPQLPDINYFVKIIRTSLTNSLHSLIADIQDELLHACDKYVPATAGVLPSHPQLL